MNRKMLVAAAIATGLAISLPAAQAQSLPTPERRAQEAAKKGVDNLRRFIHRTRMIYMLNIYAFRVPR